ncbi:MAG: ComE operon protein 2 [Bacilli bacterium]
MKRLSWEQYFLAQAHLLALRSTCTRLRVGATIVRDNRVIAGGYNGSIKGAEHCIDDDCLIVDNHCIRTIHAEVNALLQCASQGISTQHAVLYVTHFPCLNCTKSIIQSGISEVLYATNYRNNEYAVAMFKEAGVKVTHVPFKKDEVLELLAES